jgi:diketogulonate reductase-like aldo/keto reductase
MSRLALRGYMPVFASRDELIVVFHSWNQYHDPKDVLLSFEKSLTRLCLDYGMFGGNIFHRRIDAETHILVDLFLMHWPLAFKRTPDYQELKDSSGKVDLTYSFTTASCL